MLAGYIERGFSMPASPQVGLLRSATVATVAAVLLVLVSVDTGAAAAVLAWEAAHGEDQPVGGDGRGRVEERHADADRAHRSNQTEMP
jgi:hypothetical protein